jgi:hypothetical protein
VFECVFQSLISITHHHSQKYTKQSMAGKTHAMYNADQRY